MGVTNTEIPGSLLGRSRNFMEARLDSRFVSFVKSCRLAVPVIAAAILGACASPHEEQFPTVAELGGISGIEHSAVDLRLRSGDSLEIRLGGVPLEEINQVTGVYTVDTEGFVNVPGVGKVRASGNSQSELQSNIEAAFKAQGIYTNPTVTVSVPAGARFVNVGGEVRLPQRIPYTPDLTVLSAITAAGGFTEFAAQSRVRIYRGTKFSVINIRRIRDNPGLDIPLQPGDTVEIFRSFF